ncbi:MAG: DUF1499 domain-containing protein [Gammaproteobacteria bacterium]|nr:DUF1499 domain-containing protein [Gammaproteobacteria bacterium]
MRIWVRILLGAALLSVALAVGGALLHKSGIASFGPVSLIVQAGFGLSIIVAVCTIVTLFVSILRKQPYGLFTMFATFLICFLLGGYAAFIFNKVSNSPFLHNVSTDLVEPPVFSEAMLERRGPNSNPVTFDEHTKQLHREAYGDVQPVVVQTSESMSFSKALELVQDRGWEIVTMDEQAGVIEATATTFWMGFKDDVAIRMRRNEEANATTIDIRSISRVGRTDLGKNAARIREFLKDLNEVLPQS